MNNVTTKTIFQALEIIGACLREVKTSPDFDLDNFERGILEEANGLLLEDEAKEAIKALAEGCAHAFRGDYTEDRPESYACLEAWELLTGKQWSEEGGAA